MRGRFAHCAQSERDAACWSQIGSRLRAHRTHLGLSISSDARELGIGADQYLAYETGAKLAPMLLLARIADYDVDRAGPRCRFRGRTRAPRH
jgi:hypothetical protein